MRRFRVVTAAAVALLIPASVVTVAISGTASAASGVTCSKIVGTTSGTVTIEKCTPSAGKEYKKASAPATDLATGGTITWNGKATTTIGDATVGGGSSQGSCKKGSDEYTFKGTITAASTTGTGIPAKGDAVSAEACVSSSGKISLVPGTVMDL
jgi:hypothetical protein